jgi:chemotaxis protein MotB
MTQRLVLLTLAAALVACGVPEEKFYAARDAEAKALQEAKDANLRAAALDQKIAELKERLAQLEKAKSSAVADAEQQRQAAGQLAKTAEELEAQKAASEAEAERARQRAGELAKTAKELEAEKAAAAAEAERQRQRAGELAKTAEELQAQKASATSEAERQRQLAERLAAEKQDLEKRSADYQSLASSLSSEIKAGRVQVSELQGKLTVRMAEKVLFPTGSATISKDGQGTLKAVASGLQAVKGRIIRVEGHTDNVPIHNDRFPSNWELSSARAIAVVRFLQGQGIEPERLGAAGYAEYQPIASNDTAEGRAQNRRIEISLALPPTEVPKAKGGAK